MNLGIPETMICTSSTKLIPMNTNKTTVNKHTYIHTYIHVHSYIDTCTYITQSNQLRKNEWHTMRPY